MAQKQPSWLLSSPAERAVWYVLFFIYIYLKIVKRIRISDFLENCRIHVSVSFRYRYAYPYPCCIAWDPGAAATCAQAGGAPSWSLISRNASIFLSYLRDSRPVVRNRIAPPRSAVLDALRCSNHQNSGRLWRHRRPPADADGNGCQGEITS